MLCGNIWRVHTAAAGDRRPQLQGVGWSETFLAGSSCGGGEDPMECRVVAGPVGEVNDTGGIKIY